MNPTRSVVFVQNRTHRAGAQTCLARLLRHEAIKAWNPVLLCSPGGWLVEECRRIGVPVIEETFPRSRSLGGRLFGNAAFARRVKNALNARSLRPVIVQANDHQEGLLGLELAKALGARTSMFLRSPTMTPEDYRKYRCGEYDFISAVGDEFLRRVQSWEPERKIALIRDGIYADEILPPRPRAAAPPERILVIGSPLVWKGWADLTEALYLLEQEGVLPPIRFDFTGEHPDPAQNDLQLGRLKVAQCNFLGRVDGFRDLVLRYDLVINPTRMETFGMAAIEVLAAGVPLLSSRTGVIEQVLKAGDLLFRPGDPRGLARALGRLLVNWSEMVSGVPQAQENIRVNFLIDSSASRVDASYRELTAVSV